MAVSRSIADLPGDILRCIGDRAATECRPRMRAACSALRAAVPAEPQPWILLHPDDDDDDTVTDDGADRSSSSSSFSVLSLPANSKLSPTGSVARSLAAFPAGTRCVGAGHGWVALVGADLSVTLRNPVTGGAVPLPPLTTHPMVDAGGVRADGRVLWRFYLDTWPNGGDLVPAAEFRDAFVHKLVFSAAPEQQDGGCFAVVIGGRHGHAAYAAAGAAAWETLHDAGGVPVTMVRDAVHVDGGRFLAVTRWHGKVLELDLELATSNGCLPTVSIFAEPLVLTETVGCYFARGSATQIENHLVLVGGELYQIWAALAVVPPQEEEGEEEDSGTAPTRYRHHVEEVGAVRFAPERSTSWAEVADLGDWAVLVGRNETVAVRAGDATGLTGSCVYFIDGKLEGVACVFDLRSGRTVGGADVLRGACSAARPRSTTAPPV